MRQVKANETDLSRVINPEHASVPPDAALIDLFEHAVESPLPIAVVDEKQRLLGVIPRVTLLAALGNIATTTDPIALIEPVSIIPDAELDAMLARSEADAARANKTTTESTPTLDANDTTAREGSRA
jgi:glycine betaine/proline transport system ATP-binding protein